MSSPERIPTPEAETKPRIAFGFYHPETILTNEEIESWGVTTASGGLLTSEAIFKKTGVEGRFIAKKEDIVLMGLKAASQILERVESKFDFLIFSTTYPTGEHLSTEASCFVKPSLFKTLDIHAACSGFVYAFDYIREYEDWFQGKRVLIVSAEKISPTVPDLKNREEDPSLSQTIFSDGAVAVSFVYGRDLKILAIKNYEFNLEESRTLKIPVDYDLIYQSGRFGKVKFIWGPTPDGDKIEMDGKGVYEAVVRKMPGLITDTVFSAGLTFSNVSLIIPHQASRHILDGIVKRLPPNLADKIFYDVQDGNLSSAAVPKAWMRAQEEGKIKSGDKIVLATVGGGLFASIAVLEVS